MGLKMMYIISYSWYEDYNPIFLEGPEQSDWKKYCDSFVDKAVQNLLKKEDKRLIGWNSIACEIVELLKKEGYKIFEPLKADYFGSCIIRDNKNKQNLISQSLFEKVKKHNEEFYSHEY